ncbi:MAG: SPOR domain-containing protein [bacterium]|nr:MAG: SPOR domain-containing protein [bacterium]
MAKGSKKAEPRELVRLSPRQFSAAVALVVLLISGAFVLGYQRGKKPATRAPSPAVETEAGAAPADQGVETVESGSSPDRTPTITFYSELTEVKTSRPSIGRPRSGKSGSGEDARSAEPPSAPSEVQPPGDAGDIMIQVGSYRTYDGAKELLQGLTASGYNGTVIRAELGPRGVWYRVRLGPYVSSVEAKDALDVLESKMSIKGFLVR